MADDTITLHERTIFESSGAGKTAADHRKVAGGIRDEANAQKQYGYSLKTISKRQADAAARTVRTAFQSIRSVNSASRAAFGKSNLDLVQDTYSNALVSAFSRGYSDMQAFKVALNDTLTLLAKRGGSFAAYAFQIAEATKELEHTAYGAAKALDKYSNEHYVAEQEMKKEALAVRALNANTKSEREERAKERLEVQKQSLALKQAKEERIKEQNAIRQAEKAEREAARAEREAARAAEREARELQRLKSEAISTAYSGIMSLAKTITNTFTGALQRSLSVLRNFTKGINSANTAITSLTSLAGIASFGRSLQQLIRQTLGMFHRLYSFVRRGGGALNEWLGISTEIAETNHLMYTSLVALLAGMNAESVAVEDLDKELAENKELLVQTKDVFGEFTDGALKFESADIASAIRDANDALEDFADRMMLDPTSTKKTAASFLAMASSAGMAGDRAVEMSNKLTQLIYDISSLRDLQFEETAVKIRSALSGTTRAVKTLGIDVSRVSADAFLASRGIHAVYNALTLSDKYLTMYYMMLEQSQAAYGDFYRSALQPANAIRILKEQALKAARMLGNALLPVVTGLIPVFIQVAYAVQAVAKSIANWLASLPIFGKYYRKAASAWSSYTDNFTSNWAAIRAAVDDNLDLTGGAADDFNEATSAAKDFEKQLLGFDEINNLTEQKDTGGSGDSPLLGDGASVFDGVDMSDLDALYNEKWDLRPIFEEEANAIKDMFKDIMNMIPLFRVMQECWERITIAMWGGRDELKEAALWQGVLNNFIRGFKESLNSISAIFESLVIKITDFLIGTNEEGEGAAEIGKKFASIAEWVGKIVGYLPFILPILPFLASVVTAIATLNIAFGGLTGAIGPLLLLLPIGAAIFQGISDEGLGLAGVFNWLKETFEGVAEGFKKHLPDIQTALGGLWDALKVVFGWVGDNSEQIGDTIGTVVASIIDIITRVITFISESAGKFVGFFSGIVEGFKKYLPDILNAFSVLWENMSWILEHGEIIGEIIGYVITLIITTVNDIIAIGIRIVQWIRDFGGDLNMLFIGIIETIAEILDPSHMLGVARDWIWGLIEGIQDKWNSVKEWISNLGRNILQWFEDILGIASPSKEMYKIAGYFLEGFVNGIKELPGAVWDAIKGFGKKVIGWVSGIFGIASPSKVMKGLAEYCTEGFAIGFETTEDSTLNRIVNTMENISTGVVANVVGISNVTPDTISSAVGSAVSVNANAAVQSQNNDILTALNVENGLLRNQNELLAQLVAKELSVNLNGSQLANAINRESRIQGRSLVMV